MQRPIGEVFDCTLENGEIVSLQVIEAQGCNKCVFYEDEKNCKFTKAQTGACNKRSFIEAENHKLPEIDKEKQQKAKKMLLDLAQESDTFNSQREIWSYLSESEENKVIDDCGFIWGFYNGLVCCENVSATPTFANYEVYKKYTPPKTITVNGVEIEAPLRSLEGVDLVYVPCFHWEDKYFEDGANDEAGQTAFKNNMAFATKEAAIACHDALKKGIIIRQ